MRRFRCEMALNFGDRNTLKWPALVGIWFLARALVLGVARVKQNCFSPSFVAAPSCQCRRELRYRPGSSRRLQHRVIGLTGRVSERRLDGIRFEVRKVAEDFLVRHA